MSLKIVYFLSLLFVALAMTPAFAHLLELPHKITLSGTDYLVVQQVYRGWALVGIVVIAALLSTLALSVMTRRDPHAFWPSLVAFLAILGTQIVFWTFTFPVNRTTSNWTVLTSDWEVLRRQWEFSHATSALLNFVALIAMIISVLRWKD
ncbi:MAG TPA: DUF1772 domain-containing protein [Burkholderiales bacterium]|nr:DUF1772 domain-containing protein [Burkholderiales bacterium]